MHDRFRNAVYGVALAIMIGWILYIGRPIFIPVIASIIIAYIIIAFARRLSAVPVIGPNLPSWTRHAISILIIFFVIFQLISLISANIGQVLAQAPTYQATLLTFIQDLAVRLGIETEPTWESIRNELFRQVNLQALARRTITSTSGLIVTLIVVVIYTGFLLAERQLFARKLRLMSLDQDQMRFILAISREINDRVGDYLATKTFLNLILGAISWVIMKLIGINFPEFWAVLIAILNYVPYFGSFVGVALPTALAVVQFGNLGMIGVTFVGLTAAQIFVGGILEPRLLGRYLNLSPFVILVMLPVWYALWGFAGALFAVPVTAIFVIAFSEFESTRPIAILLSQTGRIPTRKVEREPESGVPKLRGR